MRDKSYQDTSWMFQQRRQPQPGPASIIDASLVNRERHPARSQIDTVVQAAWIIGACVGVVGLILSAAVIYLAYEFAPFVWALIPLSLAGAAITAAVLGILWTREAALRAWRLEDEDRRRLFDQPVPPEPDPGPQPPNDGEKLKLAGHNLLTLHYVMGSQATRPECETGLGMTQAEWNAINKILIELGVKGPRAWLIDDIHEALRRWHANVQIRSDGTAWIRDEHEPSHWRRVSL